MFRIFDPHFVRPESEASSENGQPATSVSRSKVRYGLVRDDVSEWVVYAVRSSGLLSTPTAGVSSQMNIAVAFGSGTIC